MEANRDFREWKDLQVESEKYFDTQDLAREREKEWTRANRLEKGGCGAIVLDGPGQTQAEPARGQEPKAQRP